MLNNKWLPKMHYKTTLYISITINVHQIILYSFLVNCSACSKERVCLYYYVFLWDQEYFVLFGSLASFYFLQMDLFYFSVFFKMKIIWIINDLHLNLMSSYHIMPERFICVKIHVTRTFDTSSVGILNVGHFVPKSLRTQVTSYPSHFVPKSL